MAQRPRDSVTQQKSEPIYRPFLQSVLISGNNQRKLRKYIFQEQL